MREALDETEHGRRPGHVQSGYEEVALCEPTSVIPENRPVRLRNDTPRHGDSSKGDFCCPLHETEIKEGLGGKSTDECQPAQRGESVNHGGPQCLVQVKHPMHKPQCKQSEEMGKIPWIEAENAKRPIVRMHLGRNGPRHFPKRRAGTNRPGHRR